MQARGTLKCGVNTGYAGFANPDADGRWQGFDVALCRAVAAAVVGDGEKVEFVPLTSETRFTALTSGEVDMLSRNSTWTFTRDADLKLTFAGVNYYDGQGFMVSKELGVTSAKELDGATVCVQTGTTTEVNLADFFKVNGIGYQPVPTQTPAEADQQFLGGACDAYTTDASQLATSRGSYENPDDYIILPEIISKEPLGPVVRQGDDQWADIVRWTLNALVAAEEYGVTVGQHRGDGVLAAIRRSSGSSASRATSGRCWGSTPNGPSARSWPAATMASSSPRRSARAPRPTSRAG